MASDDFSFRAQQSFEGFSLNWPTTGRWSEVTSVRASEGTYASSTCSCATNGLSSDDGLGLVCVHAIAVLRHYTTRCTHKLQSFASIQLASCAESVTLNGLFLLCLLVKM